MQRQGRRPGYTTTDVSEAGSQWQEHQDEGFEYDSYSWRNRNAENGYSGFQSGQQNYPGPDQSYSMQGYQGPGEGFTGAQGQPSATVQAGFHQQGPGGNQAGFGGSHQDPVWARQPSAGSFLPGYPGYNSNQPPLPSGNPQLGGLSGPRASSGPQVMAGVQARSRQALAPYPGQPPLPPEPSNPPAAPKTVYWSGPKLSTSGKMQGSG